MTISIYPLYNYRLTYRVVTMKVSFRMSGKISNFLAIKGVTKENVAPKLSKAYTLIEKSCNIPLNTFV